MFESVKTLDDRPNGLMCFASLLVSVAVHVAIISIIVLVPLVFCNVLPENPITFLLMDAPPVPTPPAPPTPPVARQVSTSGPIRLGGDLNDPPAKVPDGVHPPDENLDPSDIRRMIGSIPGLPQGVGLKSAVDILLAQNSERPKVEIKKPAEPQAPLPVTSTLMQSKLIRRVDPIYPPLAIKTHTSGVVRLAAVIDEQGNVTEIKIVSGHPLLVNAAVQAVEQWKYSPTILNGEPMRLVAIVEVTFILR